MRKKTIPALLAIMLFAGQACSETNPDSCAINLSDETKGASIVVESCSNMGVFSLGGLYEGVWEKLTYFYPKPWPGTYATIYIDGKYYSTSNNPKESIQMDSYVSRKPSITGDSITSSWSLPEKILAEEKLSPVTNGTLIQVTLSNQDTVAHQVGVRLHLDTMIGLNDGAPIYVPGDGLKTFEQDYSDSRLSFKYWKAYNRQDNPTIVAEGSIDPNTGFTYPEKVVIADWKKSKDSAWGYEASSSRSILGDSAVILYYNIVELQPGGNQTIKTGFGTGTPVMPKEKGVFGITELTLDNIYGKYCPGDKATASADLISSVSENSGFVVFEVSDGANSLFNQTKATGVVAEDGYAKIYFTWDVPESRDAKKYDVVAYLLDESGKEMGRVTKKSFISVNPSECVPLQEKKVSLAFIILLFLLLIVLAAVAVIILHFQKKEGKVLISKIVDEEGLVKVTVKNDTKQALQNCTVEDGIPSQAEIDVSTLAVARKGNKLVWTIGTLARKDKAILEYRVRGANVLPPAKVVWDNGEEISD